MYNVDNASCAMLCRPLSHESTDGADDLIMSAADLNQLCSLPQQHISDVLDLCLQRGLVSCFCQLFIVLWSCRLMLLINEVRG